MELIISRHVVFQIDQADSPIELGIVGRSKEVDIAQFAQLARAEVQQRSNSVLFASYNYPLRSC